MINLLMSKHNVLEKRDKRGKGLLSGQLLSGDMAIYFKHRKIPFTNMIQTNPKINDLPVGLYTWILTKEKDLVVANVNIGEVGTKHMHLLWHTPSIFLYAGGEFEILENRNIKYNLQSGTLKNANIQLGKNPKFQSVIKKGYLHSLIQNKFTSLGAKVINLTPKTLIRNNVFGENKTWTIPKFMNFVRQNPGLINMNSIELFSNDEKLNKAIQNKVLKMNNQEFTKFQNNLKIERRKSYGRDAIKNIFEKEYRTEYEKGNETNILAKLKNRAPKRLYYSKTLKVPDSVLLALNYNLKNKNRMATVTIDKVWQKMLKMYEETLRT